LDIISDFLIIGSGISGLSLALKLSNLGTVSVVTKREVSESATVYAQGGIAAVLGKEDSFEEHVQDTLKAGAGLCNEHVVRKVVEEGPARIKELMTLGAHFTMGTGNNFDLGKEGGHTKRRVVHASDFTGKEVMKTLVEAAGKSKRIRIFENHMAIDLINTTRFEKESLSSSNPAVGRHNSLLNGDIVSKSAPSGQLKSGCIGCYVLNKEEEKVDTFLAEETILATGGAGKVYLFTSNPDVATGDGIAMAWRAGASISNMEFFQFHPTTLFHPQTKSFLISEALRGEGAVLKLKDGSTFMERYHPMKELAARDIVARAIDSELKRTGDDCVFLDISHKNREFIINRFPNIYERCLSAGIDITEEPIPVVPSSHYLCGGVTSDINGRSSIPGLYVCGETACTGMHGANRMASNSLLEGLVFAEEIYKDIARKRQRKNIEFPPVPPWDPGNAVDSDESIVVSQNWDEIRRFMQNYVGIVRTDKRLERAHRRIELIQAEIKEYYWNFIITSDLLELRNIATVAELIIKSAMIRKESRGLHFNLDYPERDDINWEKDTILN